MESDWLITAITDKGASEHYRYRLEGLNTNNGETFLWSVPSISDPRYAAHPDAPADVKLAIANAKHEPRP